MDQHEISQVKKESPGEAAVNGVFGGLLGGMLMALYVLLAGQVVADSKWAYVGYLDLAHSGSPLQIIFTQLAVSAVYGAIFGLVCYWIKSGQPDLLPRWLVGLAYGMALWMLAVGFILPKDNFTLSPLSAVYLLFAYLVFGLVLGSRQKL